MFNPSFFTPESIINKNGVRRFIRTFARKDNWHEIDQDTANMGYGWVHYAFIRSIRPNAILVVGSKYGYIPAVCAVACHDNVKGIVDFVDAGYDEKKSDHNNHWGGAGIWNNIDKDKYFRKFDLAHYIRLHVMKTETFHTITPKQQWQYIYLDGDHSYEGVKRDFRYFWPHLTKGGFMVFHDLYVKRMGTFVFGVNKFWKELCKENIGNVIELPGQYGLGILQKR